MADFTTRVELHGATQQDYEILHTWMEFEGFTRTIVASDGTEYHLPTAEYNLSGAHSVATVRAMAARAAAKTGRTCWILVSEASARAWVLAPVKAPAYS